MPTDVVMPQMGESITEGTITKWLKKPGDTVQRDEPLFEISTDKVDAEIPSPVAGTLSEIKVEEGKTVTINTVVATIAEAGSASAPAASPAKAETAAAPAADTATPAAAATPAATQGNPSVAAGPGTEVLMPQMGESITEGTITKWLKKVGDTVQRDEPIFEISTDKVDAEIPSPVAGTLSEIKVGEGKTVTINTVVAVIGGAAGKSAPAAAPAVAPAAAAVPAAAAPAASASAGEGVRSSPLVRKIAKDNNVDLTQVPGSGSAGRITKTDILGHLEGGAKPAAAPAASAPAAAKPAAATPQPGELVPLTKMRSIIAQRMVESKRTSPHVHTVVKVDMTRIVKLREKEKSKYEQRNGVKLTYMPFITRAAIVALRKHPVVNAFLQGDAILYNKNINVGIAVALDWGLIVPVLKQTEEKNFLGIARGIVDVADRAHADQLRHLRRAVRHADHQPAAERHPRHRRPQQGSRSHHRQGRQRVHCHPFDPALHPWLRSPHRRWSRRRKIHVRLQGLPRKLERRHRVKKYQQNKSGRLRSSLPLLFVRQTMRSL
jgi:pyruvate dehydrogenase E2 component (dihydrolipoamide acetyltransferase)